MKFTIEGPPATKKTSQRIVTNKRTGKPFVIASKSTKGWTAKAVEQLQGQLPDFMAGVPTKVIPHIFDPVNCTALVYRHKRVGDLVNYMQAIADALEESGVVANDRQIVSWDGSKLLHDRDNPRVEIELTPATKRKD